ncbi:7465_t:CDS:2 [Rhizophagus irregularis]|nr:7465_t:CDS:2 [Rhizophagus irregularis]
MSNVPEFYVARFSVKQYNLAHNPDSKKTNSSATSEVCYDDSKNDYDDDILSDSTIKDDESFSMENSYNTSLTSEENITFDITQNANPNIDSDSDYVEPSNRKSNRKLNRKSNKKSNRKFAINKNNKPYPCKYPGCGKKFSDSASLLSHRVTIHTFNKKYVCHNEIDFMDKSDLNKRKSTGIKLHICDEPGCGKGLTRSSSLTLHKRIHTGEKPYSCDNPKCGKRFTQLGHLSTHKKSHIRRKPFVCNKSGCNKKYKVSSSLYYHLRLHNGDVPFPCDYEGCDKKYTHYGSLLAHKKKHKY